MFPQGAANSNKKCGIPGCTKCTPTAANKKAKTGVCTACAKGYVLSNGVCSEFLVCVLYF